MWACICFVIGHSTWFGFACVALAHHSDEVARLHAHQLEREVELPFQLLFVVLMLIAIVSFIRERSSIATPSV